MTDESLWMEYEDLIKDIENPRFQDVLSDLQERHCTLLEDYRESERIKGVFMIEYEKLAAELKVTKS